MLNVKFYSVLYSMMVFMKKCNRFIKNMIKVLLNEGIERENSPNFLQHFSF